MSGHGLGATCSLCRRQLKLRWRLGQDGFRFDVNSYIFKGVPQIDEAVFRGKGDPKTGEVETACA